MVPGPSGRTVFWVQFNIGMFCAYALFGAVSLFWPSALQRLWLYPFHLVGLVYVLAVVYGLVNKRRWVAALIVIYAIGMIGHLVVFILSPLSMMIAYIGPSRSFYTLSIMTMPLLGAEEYPVLATQVFNAVMVVVHSINILYFSRARRMAGLWETTRPGLIS